MKKIRIGKDINVRWEITLPEGIDTLYGLNLSLDMRDPKGNKVKINEFELEGDNVVLFGLRGTAFVFIGNYSFTLWVNKGELGQTLVDCINAFQLVTSTDKENEENGCGCGVLEVSTIDIYGDLTFPIIEGPKGDKGDPGEPGKNGQPGFSPIATVSKTGDTATITITDKNGTTTATVKDGSDTIDSTPTENSNNAVSSGGVYNAIASLIDAVDNKIGQSVSFTYTYADNTTVTYNLLTSNS